MSFSFSFNIPFADCNGYDVTGNQEEGKREHPRPFQIQLNHLLLLLLIVNTSVNIASNHTRKRLALLAVAAILNGPYLA